MFGIERSAEILKAAGEPTRLRILLLLSRGDLTVTDLTFVLNQSQPRVSRHLKLLMEAALVQRHQEGSWAYFRLSDMGDGRVILDSVLSRLDERAPEIERDLERLASVRRARQERASNYFAQNAQAWDALRSMHVPDEAVESAMLAAVGTKRVDAMLDLGTGTGRILELFADHYQRATGVDLSRDMLAVARAKLDAAGITHASVRHGDVLAPPVARDSFDLVVIHQVLHYMDEPAALIAEAAKALRPEGLLLIADFESHQLEYLRDEHAHTRLGFSDQQIRQWCEDTDLDLVAVETFAAVGGTENDQTLTVKLWVAQDPRVLMADPGSIGGDSPALAERTA